MCCENSIQFGHNGNCWSRVHYVDLWKPRVYRHQSLLVDILQSEKGCRNLHVPHAMEQEIVLSFEEIQDDCHCCLLDMPGTSLSFSSQVDQFPKTKLSLSNCIVLTTLWWPSWASKIVLSHNTAGMTTRLFLRMMSESLLTVNLSFTCLTAVIHLCQLLGVWSGDLVPLLTPNEPWQTLKRLLVLLCC